MFVAVSPPPEGGLLDEVSTRRLRPDIQPLPLNDLALTETAVTVYLEKNWTFLYFKNKLKTADHLGLSVARMLQAFVYFCDVI